MTTAGMEEALLPNDSLGKKQPEVFGSVQRGFVSNRHPHPWTLYLLSLSLFPSSNFAEP